MGSEPYVDQELCIGCGLCVSIAPEVFRLNESGVSEVYANDLGEREKVQQAIDSCPVSCISWR